MNTKRMVILVMVMAFALSFCSTEQDYEQWLDEEVELGVGDGEELSLSEEEQALRHSRRAKICGLTSVVTDTIPSFCDSSLDHGPSTSCKDEVEVTGHVCSNGGNPGNSSCSVGNACAEAGSPGTVCDCTIRCIKTTCSELDVESQLMDAQSGINMSGFH